MFVRHISNVYDKLFCLVPLVFISSTIYDFLSFKIENKISSGVLPLKSEEKPTAFFNPQANCMYHVGYPQSQSCDSVSCCGYVAETLWQGTGVTKPTGSSGHLE